MAHIAAHLNVYITRSASLFRGVSRLGLVVRRSAGKQKDTGSTPLLTSAHLSLQKLWFMDSLVTALHEH